MLSVIFTTSPLIIGPSFMTARRRAATCCCSRFVLLLVLTVGPFPDPGRLTLAVARVRIGRDGVRTAVLSPSTGRRPDGAADAAAGEMPDALIGPVNGVTLFTPPKNGLKPVKNGLALKKNGLTLLAPVKPKPGTNPFTLELNPKPGTKLKSGLKKVPGLMPTPDGFAGLSGVPPRPKVGSSVVAGLTTAPREFAGLNTPLTG